MVDKITTILKSKVGERIGRLDDEDVVRLNQAVMVFLGLAALVGRAAQHDDLLVVDDPPASYLRVRSGLGEGAPKAIVLCPLVQAGKVGARSVWNVGASA